MQLERRAEGGNEADTYLHVTHPLLLFGARFFRISNCAIDLSSFACMLGKYRRLEYSWKKVHLKEKNERLSLKMHCQKMRSPVSLTPELGTSSPLQARELIGQSGFEDCTIPFSGKTGTIIQCRAERYLCSMTTYIAMCSCYLFYYRVRCHVPLFVQSLGIVKQIPLFSGIAKATVCNPISLSYITIRKPILSFYLRSKL